MWYLPLLGQPVELHSSRDPGNCTLTPEQCAYKSRYWVNWYQSDLVFGLSAIYFFVATIAVFTIFRFVSELAPTSLTRSKAWRRCVSVLRFLSYRSFRVAGRNSQTLGAYILGGVGFIFFAALVLGPKPYYWPTDAHYGNSPPIATRAGWLALGCLPFVLALGAKANMVTALTGIPPEKLNVWHNWISWAMFVLALIHTFPFVVFRKWNGDLHEAFVTGGFWITGVIALIAQAWLTFMSISWIRNRYYEFFKATHFFFAIVFLIFFFLHCGFTMTSWDYFIATGILYSLCLLYSFGKTYVKHGLSHTARLTLETPHTLRIAIDTKSGWSPGQHMFLRFLSCGAHVLTAHPLTICSLPSKDSKGGELVFYVQPRGGLTGRLATMARKQPGVGVNVLLEGPYGGMTKRWSKGFDRTLVICGGSGSGFALSLIEDWLRIRASSTERECKVVLATKDGEMRSWYIEALQQIASRQSVADLGEIPGLSIHIYETHSSQPRGSSQESDSAGPVTSGDDDEKAQSPVTDQDNRSKGELSSIITLFGVKFLRGRPATTEIFRELTSQQGATVGVAVCGPSSMVHDAASEAAASQQRILKGDSGASEVWFHKEAFSFATYEEDWDEMRNLTRGALQWFMASCYLKGYPIAPDDIYRVVKRLNMLKSLA